MIIRILNTNSSNNIHIILGIIIINSCIDWICLKCESECKIDDEINNNKQNSKWNPNGFLPAVHQSSSVWWLEVSGRPSGPLTAWVQYTLDSRPLGARPWRHFSRKYSLSGTRLSKTDWAGMITINTVFTAHCGFLMSPYVVMCSPLELNALQFFCSDFEKILTQLHWPNISPTAQSPVPTGGFQELNVQLELLVAQLLALQTTYPSAPHSPH